MTPTLAIVLLLIALDISSSNVLFSCRDLKLSHRLKTKNVGGWSGYISEHMKEGTVTDREHVAFLNMWLKKFVFCGKSFGPTSNYQIMAEQLAIGSSIPLGKYLLGVVYNLLHQVVVSLSTNSPIGTLGGPWWFINMWLNLHLRDRLEQNIFDMRFPGEQPDSTPIVKRRCMNFGEIVYVFPGHKKTPSCIVTSLNLCVCKFRGFQKLVMSLCAYELNKGVIFLPPSLESYDCSCFDPQMLGLINASVRSWILFGFYFDLFGWIEI
jgi:hypothetical protein